MNKQRLFELYEKSYFHEMEVREKITGRVQITFALVATGYTIISYMFRMLDYTSDKSAVIFFIILMLVCVLLSISCIVCLVKAFWGNEYLALPSACDTDDYRDKLIEYNKNLKKYNSTHENNIQQLDDIDLKMMNYIYKHYKDCSSHNGATNDKRSRKLHLSFKWLLFSAIPLILSSFVFIISDLDVSSPRKETPIINVTLTQSVNELKSAITVFSEQQKQRPIIDAAISNDIDDIKNTLLNFANQQKQFPNINAAISQNVKELKNALVCFSNQQEQLLQEISMSDERNDLPPPPPEAPEPRVLIEDSHPTPSADDSE